MPNKHRELPIKRPIMPNTRPLRFISDPENSRTKSRNSISGIVKIFLKFLLTLK